jgi:phospholipase/carboxylesterase
MAQSTLPSIEINTNPNNKPTASVIWLHGLGADGHDFADIAPQLNLPKEASIRFIFPHAPIRPITINGGFKMRAWFDCYALDANAPQDELGIRESQQAIEQLIQKELASGIPSNKIVLAGFSQGGAMALHCGLRYTQQLAGILVLSGFLPLAAKLANELNNNNLATPILMLHGENDDIVPLEWAMLSKNKLENLKLKIEWHTYQIRHHLCADEIYAIAKWLRLILSL